MKIQVQRVIKKSGTERDDIYIYGSNVLLNALMEALKFHTKEREKDHIVLRNVPTERSAAILEMIKSNLVIDVERLQVKDSRVGPKVSIKQPPRLETLTFDYPVSLEVAREKAKDLNLMRVGYSLVADNFPIGIKRGQEILSTSWTITSDETKKVIEESREKLYWKDLPPIEGSSYKYVEDPKGDYYREERNNHVIPMGDKSIKQEVKRYKKVYLNHPQCPRCNQYIVIGPDNDYCPDCDWG